MGNTTILNAAVLRPGDGTASGTDQNGTLTFGSGANLTVNTGGEIVFQISTPSKVDALTFEGGQYTYNGTNYANAGLLFAAESTAVTNWNIAPSASTNHDYLSVTGSLSLTGGSKVTVVANGTPSYNYGQVFNLIDWTSANMGTFNAGTGFSSGGSFGDFNLDTLGGGLAWDTSAFTSYGILVVVPEPSRMLLLMFGLLGLLFRRRRRYNSL